MAFALYFTASAEKDFRRLDKESMKALKSRLEKARENPELFVKRLTGVKLFSLRSGDYRAILSIDWASKKIIVLRIGHRKNVYAHI